MDSSVIENVEKEKNNIEKLFHSAFKLVDKWLKDSAVLVGKRAINIFHKLAVEIFSRKEIQSELRDLEPELSLHPDENLFVTISGSFFSEVDGP